MILKFKTKRKKRTVQKKSVKKLENNNLKFLHLAASAAEEKKGEDILLLDVSKLTVISDYFMIITAKSTAQIQALANNIKEQLAKNDLKLISKEGFTDSTWVVLDFGNIIVHIMREQERNYYKLERFWSNATVIDSKPWKKAC